MRSERRPDIPSKRICLVLQSGIGDVVHGLPLVNALVRDDPERRISWVVERMPAPLLRPHPAVDEVILYDRTGGLKEMRALKGELARRSFDLVINCGIHFKSAIPTLMARAPQKAGFGKERAKDLVWLTANHRLPPRGPRHRGDMYLEFLDLLGIEGYALEWRLVITDEELGAAAAFFAEQGEGPFVGIVPTSAIVEKDWAVERFADLATALERDFGFRVVLLGGPGDREVDRAREVAERSRARTIWALGPELRRLVALVEGCDLVIAPDTGPLHIARALETPVIGLYGRTDPERSGPYKAYADLTVDRFNYDAPGVPYSGPPEVQHPAQAGARAGRMELIKVADVLEKVRHAQDRYLKPVP